MRALAPLGRQLGSAAVVEQPRIAEGRQDHVGHLGQGEMGDVVAGRESGTELEEVVVEELCRVIADRPDLVERRRVCSGGGDLAGERTERVLWCARRR